MVKFSPQQSAFLKWAETGRGSCLLEAVAGAGKTTTLLAAAERMQGQVAILAYNKKIADEIKDKLKGRGIDYKKAQAGTVHSFGFSAYRKQFPKVAVNGDKVANLVDEMVQMDLLPYRTMIAKLVSLAKQRAIGVTERFSEDKPWLDIIEHFDLLEDIDIDTEDDNDLPLPAIVAQARAILRASNQDTGTIDFDDMVYLPLVYKVRFWRFDVVMVDEAQDTNPARRALVRALVRPGGRVIAVGDRHQAIYGFCHPPGVMVMTPSGPKAIEDVKAGDAVILGDTAGNVAGWTGGQTVIQKHVFDYDEEMLTLSAGGRSVAMTLHHRVPVKIDPSAEFFTYLMSRNGVFRAGYMAAYAKAGLQGDKVERRFMLSQRCIMEGCDRAWLLQAFKAKEAAVDAAAQLTARVKNTTFNQMTDEQVAALPSDAEAADAILREHGRRSEFPFLIADHRNDRKVSHAFITEACNVMDGMLVSVLGDYDGRRRGRARQITNWRPVAVSRKPYCGKTHGITVPVLQKREGYSQWPLYFADGILVHNTGADNDSLDLIAKDFSCVRLPLTVTYRCPKAVVSFAKQWVSHIEAAASAPEGEVTEIDMDAFLASTESVGAGDAVLCRNTKPLVSLAFDLIRRRVPCRVEGRDVAARLKKFTTRWKVKEIPAFVNRLEAHLSRETTKLLAKGKEAQLQALEDCIETLKVMADQCMKEGKRQVSDVTQYLDELFGDNVTDTLVLSTIHKSKGREWSRVFWLDRAGTCPSRYARKDWQQEQEVNLMYVAATRAQGMLVDLTLKSAAQQQQRAA